MLIWFSPEARDEKKKPTRLRINCEMRWMIVCEKVPGTNFENLK